MPPPLHLPRKVFTSCCWSTPLSFYVRGGGGCWCSWLDGNLFRLLGLQEGDVIITTVIATGIFCPRTAGLRGTVIAVLVGLVCGLPSFITTKLMVIIGMIHDCENETRMPVAWQNRRKLPNPLPLPYKSSTDEIIQGSIIEWIDDFVSLCKPKEFILP